MRRGDLLFRAKFEPDYPIFPDYVVSIYWLLGF
jgi:hypothetical protein